MKFKNVLFSCLVTSSLILTACGGKGEGGANPPEGGTVGSSNTGSYDLAEYIFPDEVGNVGGFTSYKIRTFDKNTGEEILGREEGGIGAQFDSEQVERTAADTIVFSINNTSEPLFTFIIDATSIEKTVHRLDNQNNLKSTKPRFVNIGDTFSDGTVNLGNEPLEQNGNCSVIEHFDSFDLSSATGSFRLASGNFNDVLHTQCTTIVDGKPELSSDIHEYFAKGKGRILEDLNLPFLGEIYEIPQKAGTSADTDADTGTDSSSEKTGEY